jgi:CheY-like chemotaxis protein
VLRAERARQALEIVRNSGPVDVVVSDIGMPEMQGTQLVREVADLSPRTESMLTTGGSIDPAEIPEGVPVLKKPFSIPDLITLQATLARSTQSWPV